MTVLSPTSSRNLSLGQRLLAPSSGALRRLLAHCQAPVIGIGGTGQPELTMDLIAAMLKARGIRTAVGLGPALGQMDSLGPEDRVLIELGSGLLRQAAGGLAMLVLGGLAADELAPDQSAWELGDALARAATGTAGCVVANGDDARVLGLLAQAGVDPVRVSANGGGGMAFIRGDELVIVDPQLQLERRVCRLDQTLLRGPAFQSNLLLAAAAAAIAGAEVEDLRRTLGAYQPGPDRLQRVATRQRVRWYSDGAANRPGLSALALRSLAGERVVLIAGGRHGGQPLDRWRDAVGRHADAVLLYGSAGPDLAAALRSSPSLVVRCADLEDAVGTAHSLAQAGSAVLFSPGCEPDDLLSPPPGEAFRRALSQLLHPNRQVAA